MSDVRRRHPHIRVGNWATARSHLLSAFEEISVEQRLLCLDKHERSAELMRVFSEI